MAGAPARGKRPRDKVETRPFAPLFGWLIGTGSTWALAAGYTFAAAMMVGAAAIGAKLGIDAEGHSLEQIADPLSSEAGEPGR